MVFLLIVRARQLHHGLFVERVEAWRSLVAYNAAMTFVDWLCVPFALGVSCMRWRSAEAWENIGRPGARSHAAQHGISHGAGRGRMARDWQSWQK